MVETIMSHQELEENLSRNLWFHQTKIGVKVKENWITLIRFLMIKGTKRIWLRKKEKFGFKGDWKEVRPMEFVLDPTHYKWWSIHLLQRVQKVALVASIPSQAHIATVAPMQSSNWYLDSRTSHHVTNVSQNIQQLAPFEGDE